MVEDSKTRTPALEEADIRTCDPDSESQDDDDNKIWSGVGEIIFRPFMSNGEEKEALSLNSPDPTDKQNNSRLIAELRNQGGYESKERNVLRNQILSEVGRILSDWAVEYIQRRTSETLTASAACQIVPFGSFCLGVHTAESDIDVLCVVPRQISRGDFFSEVPQLLGRCEKIDKSTLLTVRPPLLIQKRRSNRTRRTARFLMHLSR